MIEAVPTGLWIGASAAFGLAVGSFLNVAIHRLPEEGLGIGRPARSFCPHCRRQLGWRENLPLLSFAIQGGRCRGCRARISWRYPLVELLTACLWVLVAVRQPPQAWELALVQVLVLSGLVVATFVDFARFEIPDEVSLGGVALAPIASLLVPELHRGQWIAEALSEPGAQIGRAAALADCLAGMAVGAALLLGIGWIGRRIWGRDAMGLGDVKLLAAGGGFVGPGGALLALAVGALTASVAGAGNMLRWAAVSAGRARRRGSRRGPGRAIQSARVLGRYVPFGPYLGIGIGIALLAWNDVSAWLR